MQMKTWVLMMGLLATGGAACSGEDAAEGTLAIEIWGEEFIEDGIPASAFVDGWTVTFDRFLVTIDGVAAARGEAAPDLRDDTQRVFDLTAPGPHPLLTRPAPAGAYDHTTFRIRPAGAAAIAGNATTADVDRMRTGGYSVVVEGTATRGTESKTFRWGFASDTVYDHCESGARLEARGAASIQLTIHADHLFYDDLVAEDPDVTFDVLARADTDGDGEVTSAELAAFDITALPNYGTGSTSIDNLWDFIVALTATMGHIDGEGHCHARPGP